LWVLKIKILRKNVRDSAWKTGDAAGILRVSAYLKGTASGLNCRFCLSEDI
jgi:hypothetical protein